MAAALQGDRLGRLHDPHGGCDDLGARVVRILHDRSFIDDPTRLLRAVRYEVRLDFRIDEPTEELAREAARRDALATVSGPRIRDELLDLLAEHAAPRGVARFAELGLLETLSGGLTADPELVASAKLGAGETGADPALTALAALLGRAARRGVGRVARPSRGRTRRRAPRRPKGPAARAHGALRPARLGDPRAAPLRASGDARADARATARPGGPILRYLADLQGVRLDITGRDLVEAGVPESPALGRALEETLRKKLDGELAGREEELRFALEVARSTS